MRLSTFPLALAGLSLLASLASAGELYLDAYTRDFTETTALGGAGSGQTFWPMDATCYNGEATLDLKQITFWSGCLGGGNATTYIAIYDGDPDLATSTLVGSSTNAVDTTPGCIAQFDWTFNNLTLNATVEYWAVLSTSQADDNLTTIVGKSLLTKGADVYGAGTSLIANRSRHSQGQDLAFHVTFEGGPLSGCNPPSNGFCYGDGTATACPCGNAGAAGEGCANSSGSGAILAESGTTSVLADDLVFTGANLLPNQPALLFSGLNAVNGGAGNVFGDGLRCAGGSVMRLGVRIPDSGGNATWGPGLGAIGGWVAGDTRRFQTWYRDPSGSPCGSAFNLSHGVELLFVN